MLVHLLSNYKHQFRPTRTTNVDVRAPDLKHRRQMVYVNTLLEITCFLPAPIISICRVSAMLIASRVSRWADTI
jgi:hypothetical protein